MSTVGALEGLYFKKYSKLIDMSVQQLIDCCKLNVYGCQGGDPRPALNCLKMDGIMKETD
jgi:hypothetical protein